MSHLTVTSPVFKVYIPSGTRKSKSIWTRTHACVIDAVCAFLFGEEFDRKTGPCDFEVFARAFENLAYATSDNALKGGRSYAYDGVEEEATRHLDTLMIRVKM